MMTAKNQALDRKLIRLSREILDVACALYEVDERSESVPFRERYRDKNTGVIYEVICNATLASGNVLMVVFRNAETGDRWIMTADEFVGGIFERVA